MQIIKVSKSVHPDLYQKLIQKQEHLINYNEYYVNIFDEEAAKLLDNESYQQLIAAPVCPICGRRITTGLVMDYRDDGTGVVNKYLTCPGCVFLRNEEFYKLYNTPMEYKTEEFLKIIDYPYEKIKTRKND
jgi:hypothetical protein